MVFAVDDSYKLHSCIMSTRTWSIQRAVPMSQAVSRCPVTEETPDPPGVMVGRSSSGTSFFTPLFRRVQWSRGLKHASEVARLVELWVRILPTAWMFVSCECCALSGRGLLPSVGCLSVIEKPR